MRPLSNLDSVPCLAHVLSAGKVPVLVQKLGYRGCVHALLPVLPALLHCTDWQPARCRLMLWVCAMPVQPALGLSFSHQQALWMQSHAGLPQTARAARRLSGLQ